MVGQRRGLIFSSCMPMRRAISARSLQSLPGLGLGLTSNYVPKHSTLLFLPPDQPRVEKLEEICCLGWRRPSNAYDEVYPRIFLGGERAAEDIQELSRLGVTHVLNAACMDVYTGHLFYRSRNFPCSYMGIAASDHPSYRLNVYFEDAINFIDDALKSYKGKVLVHCREGISRSATLVLAFLMKKKNMSVTDAVRSVRNKRAIFPNSGFLQQLCDFDQRLSNFRNYY